MSLWLWQISDLLTTDKSRYFAQPCPIIAKTEQYFPVVLFVMLYKVVLTFEPVDEILKCDQATELYFPVILYVALNKVVLTSLFYSQMCPSVRTITAFNKQKLAHLK